LGNLLQYIYFQKHEEKVNVVDIGRVRGKIIKVEFGEKQ